MRLIIIKLTTMKKIYLFIAVLMLVQACKKNGSDNVSLEDQLTDVQIKNIEAEGIDTTSTYQNAIFADGTKMSMWEKTYDSGYVYIFNLRGTPAEDKERLFINSMTHAGFILTYRIGYPNFPGQYGLAYVNGSKNFLNPSTYSGASCQYSLWPRLFGYDLSNGKGKRG